MQKFVSLYEGDYEYVCMASSYAQFAPKTFWEVILSANNCKTAL